MGFELLPLKPEQHTITFIPRLSIELPFFNLTVRRKGIPKVIKYSGRDDAGRPIRWEVYQDTSEEIGAPAVEAHEVWYLLVKPSIDGQRRADGTIPEIIPLGGIRDCLRKVGWTIGGFQARELIKSLTQISFAGCVADLWVPTGERDEAGKERFLQIKGRFSRLSVYAIGEYHLTAQELAESKFDFDLEDILYIRLDPLEAKLQQLQDQRILDNQYLFSLKPAARRWYELMAAKIFGVVSNKGTFCEIRYSWYTQQHHTLKRYVEHKRVRFQMDRVIKDHIESGYIAKAEYRAVKEPDQLIDYIIRYYPGPGATASMDRVQTHLRQRKASRQRLSPAESNQKRATSLLIQATEPRSLSVVTANHQQLMIELILKFGINASKAYGLVMSRSGAVKFQLDVWSYRQVAPRNRAGWMIQAIENNYGPPSQYLDDRKKQEQQQAVEAVQAAVRECVICNDKGFRYIKNSDYPNGAMRQCSHNETIEAQYTDSLKFSKPVADDALEGSIRGEKTQDDKRPAESPASL
jgi:hypothetical protein